MSDTKNYKADFPVFAGNKNLVYLDSSATTQKPQAVLDAVNKYYNGDFKSYHKNVSDHVPIKMEIELRKD